MITKVIGLEVEGRKKMIYKEVIGKSKLKKAKVESIVLDLRNNGGGSLAEVVC